MSDPVPSCWKNSFRNSIKVSKSFDPLCCVGPNLDQNYLQRLYAKKTLVDKELKNLVKYFWADLEKKSTHMILW